MAAVAALSSGMVQGITVCIRRTGTGCRQTGNQGAFMVICPGFLVASRYWPGGLGRPVPLPSILVLDDADQVFCLKPGASRPAAAELPAGRQVARTSEYYKPGISSSAGRAAARPTAARPASGSSSAVGASAGSLMSKRQPLPVLATLTWPR